MDHRSAPLNTVALSATCLLAVSPLLALDAGFLLTFGATLGILLGVPPILSRVRPMLEPMGRWGQWLLVPLLGLFAATVCAELALVPVAGGAAFSRVTIAGLALNFVAIPLMAVAQLAEMCAVGGGLVMSEFGGTVRIHCTPCRGRHRRVGSPRRLPTLVGSTCTVAGSRGGWKLLPGVWRSVCSVRAHGLYG